MIIPASLFVLVESNISGIKLMFHLLLVVISVIPSYLTSVVITKASKQDLIENQTVATKLA